jgi:hypothetical protein
MIRVSSGYEAASTKGVSADRANGSEKVFDALLDQINKGGTGKLSPQTLQDIFKDVADGTLSAGQAASLIETAVQNGQLGAISLSGLEGISPDSLKAVFPDVAQGTPGTGEPSGQYTQLGSLSSPKDSNFLVGLLQDVASGAISTQTGLQLIGAANQDGGASIPSYGVGNRSGHFLTGPGHDMGPGRIGPNDDSQLIPAVQAAEQTPT